MICTGLDACAMRPCIVTGVNSPFNTCTKSAIADASRERLQEPKKTQLRSKLAVMPGNDPVGQHNIG